MRTGTATPSQTRWYARDEGGRQQGEHLLAAEHAQVGVLVEGGRQPPQARRRHLRQPGLLGAGREREQPPAEPVAPGQRVAFDHALGLQRAQRP
ncbi:hypothetical protein ACFSTC_41750 [Nonomuraea ferruginea]